MLAFLHEVVLDGIRSIGPDVGIIRLYSTFMLFFNTIWLGLGVALSGGSPE